MRKFFAILILLSATLQSHATHLVGGEMTYVRLGGNTIRVTLTVYRDNINGSPGAYFDGTLSPVTSTYQPACVISYYNDNGVYLESDSINLNSMTVVQPILNPCQDEMPNIETQRGVYTFDVNLNNVNGYNPALGVTLVYGRCCRNGIINNLFDPGNQGFSAIVRVPPANIINNSPTFNGFEQYLCAGRHNLLSFAATDTDGDSLVYHLCDPLLGLDAAAPAADYFSLNSGMTYPNYGPPYNMSVWETGYDANNPFGMGTTTLNRNTGTMDVNMPMTGVYVMRVCVSEYRNGVWLSTISRDFQYLVTPCDFPDIEVAIDPNIPRNPINGLYTIDAKCNEGTINFRLANNASIVSYQWNFGNLNTTSDVSTLQSPSYTYTDTGTYVVTVIGYAADGCADTSRGLVTFYPVFTPDFMYEDSCANMAVQFADISTSTSGNVNSWKWNFGDPFSSSDISLIRSPSYTYTQAGTYNVSVVVTTSKGCIDTVYHPITIHPTPNLSFAIPNSICLNDTINFSNTSTISGGNITGYTWQIGGNQYTTNNITYTFSAVGTVPVTLTAMSNLGCPDTLQRNITVHPLPNITLNDSATICPNTSLQLQAGGGVSYNWTPATYLNNPNIANPLTTPASAIKYTVSVTDANGCRNKDSIQINLAPAPLVDAGEDTSVCLNPGSFRDSVRLQASGAASYVWTPPTGLSSATAANPLSRPSQNMTYFVTGTDINGCQATDSVTVYFLDPALNLIVENTKDICQYDTTTLSIQRQGNSTFSWTPATGLSDPTSNEPRFFPLDTTTYIFTVQNYCYQKSDTTTIIVHPLPSIGAGNLDSVCIGNSVQLNATGATSYRWNYSPTLSDSVISNPFAFPTTTTTYYVRGTDIFGCSADDSITVLVYLPPITDVLPNTPYICFGSSIQLNASGGVRYHWTQNNTTLSDTTVSNPLATPQDTTVYHVVITNVHNCSTLDSVRINVQHPITVVAQPLYDVCEGDIVRLSSSGGLYYSWNPPDYLDNPTSSSPNAQPNANIIYTVRVSNDCFQDSAQVEIIIRPKPTAEAGNDTTIYRNTSAQLHGESNAVTHYWSPNDYLSNPLDLDATASPLFTRTYYLFAETEYGCVNYDSVLITVEPKTVLLVPTGFSPNDDGVNDIFRIAMPMLNIQTIEEFAVFNRWGEKVFYTTDPNAGWDGRYKGLLQQMSTFTWYVSAKTYDGEKVFKKGNVTLVR